MNKPRFFYNHLEFLTYPAPGSTIAGSSTDLENKLRKIAIQLPDIFVAGQWEKDIIDVELTKVKTAKDGYAQAQREKDRLLDWRDKANDVADLYKSGKVSSAYDEKDILTLAKKDIYDFFYLGKGAIESDAKKFWTDLENDLKGKTAANVKTELDAIKGDIKTKLVDASEVNVLGWQKDILAGLDVISPLHGTGTFIFIASNIQETAKNANFGGTITLTIDNAKGALKADGFALEKAAGKSVPLTGSDLPKEVQIIFQNDKSIDARYKKLLQDLKKDLNIEIEITHAENIGWDDTLKRFTLNDVDFGNVKVERDKALDNKIKKWQVKIEKIITDYSTSTFGATQIEAKASKNHWGDADRGGDGATWQQYLDTVTGDTGGNYTDFDHASGTIARGVLENIVRDLIQRFVDSKITKKEIQNFQTNWLGDPDIPNVNYFNNPDGEIDKIIDNSKGKKEIDVGLKGKNVEEVIKGLKGMEFDAALKEIQDFFTKKSNPTWKEITDKAKEIQTEVGNPMAGADITMANFRKNKGSLSADLNFQTMVKGAKNIKFKSSATNKDAFASAKNERWLNYESYATSGDGNCFLNSFSIMMEGKNDKKWAIPIRLAICLGLMTDKDWTGSAKTKDEDAAKETTRLLMHRTEKNAEGTSNTNCRIAYDGDWCTGADIEYVARVLERPIGLVYRAAAVNGVLVPNTTEPDYIVARSTSSGELTYKHNEPWFAYMTDSQNHFQALARPEDHQEGKFEFTADDIEVDDGKQAIFFTFKKGSIKYPGFTPKNVKTLENKKDLNIKDAEVLAIHYSNDDWGKVDYADQTDALKDNSSKQIDKVGHTFVISLARAFGDSDSKRNIRLEKGAYKGKDVIRMDQFNVENVYLVPKKS